MWEKRYQKFMCQKRKEVEKRNTKQMDECAFVFVCLCVCMRAGSLTYIEFTCTCVRTNRKLFLTTDTKDNEAHCD